jgi:cold shock protein
VSKTQRRKTVFFRPATLVAGTVKWFDDIRGFGYILGPDGSRDIFVHYSAIDMDGFKKLKEGEAVEYAMELASKGPRAVYVRKAAMI